MKVAVVGAGYTGMAAAEVLLKRGCNVTIFEKDDLGGMAATFSNSGWEWELEKNYHHIFTNDQAIIDLAQRVGHKVLFKNVATGIYSNKSFTQLDSPLSLIKYRWLRMCERIRVGVALLLMKLIKDGRFLERYTITDILPKLIGNNAYEELWKVILHKKFGGAYNKINMAWFWARVFKRTKQIGYFEGGFSKFAKSIEQYLTSHGGKFRYNTTIKSIKVSKSQVIVNGECFQKALITTPSPLIEKLMGKTMNPRIGYLHSRVLVLELSNSLLPFYWVNISDEEIPFLIAIEHTKFIDKNNYNNNHIVYIANYIDDAELSSKISARELTKLYLPYLRQLNPKFQDKWILKSRKFDTKYAQPIFTKQYSKSIPKHELIKNLIYASNQSYVYPWDRGVNYAVKWGQQAANCML